MQELSTQSRFTLGPAAIRLIQVLTLAVPLLLSGCNGSQSRIVFDGQSDIPYEIYAANVNGGSSKNLTDNPDWDDYYPAWSPDGRQIAFVSNREGGINNVYTMNTNGSHQVKITTAPGGNIMPVWSPDGTKIAFLSGRQGSWDIYIMNTDGSDPIRLTNDVNNSYPLWPVDFAFEWSPDGTQIAFAPNDGNIYLVNTDGSGQITLSNKNDSHPVWSPDGTKIAFLSKRDGEWGVYVMNADGSSTISLSGSGSDHDPVWSPDGTKIAFVSFRSYSTGNQEIFVMNADGSGLINLTNNPDRDENPVWSPDGTQIAFESGSYIYKMNADGSNVVQVSTTRLQNIISVDWMP